MASILLLILKIIGFLLIGIASLLLLLCILVLFVPICYEVSGQKDEKTLIEGRITYLFRFIKIYFSFDGDLNYSGKILFTTIFSSKKQDQKPPKSKPTNQALIEMPSETIQKNKGDGAKAEIKQEQKPEIKQEKNTEIKQESFIKTEKKKIKKRKVKKIKGVKRESQIGNTFSKIKDILTNQEYRGALQHIFTHLKRVLRSILPRRFRLYLKFGTYDPALTGCLLGLISIFYAIPGNSMVIEADFEHTVINGNFEIKGRIFVFVLVYHGIRVYLDKRVKKLIAEFIY